MTTSQATPSRLYLLPLMTATVPVGEQMVAWSAGSYLIQMSDGELILLDTGPPPDFPLPADQPATNVVARLASLGLRPDDIGILICSHFDIDHVGDHAQFPGAELVVQRAQLEAARSGHPRFAAGARHWAHPAARYRIVDGDTELRPDLTLLSTPGHVPGHQSVLVRLPRTGPVLLTVDAVAMELVFTPERPPMPWLDEDHELLVASTRKLINLVDREDVSLVVFHHDGAQWQSLATAPDFYD